MLRHAALCLIWNFQTLVIILCSVNFKYTNLILEIRLRLVSDVGLVLTIINCKPNLSLKHDSNLNLISKIKFVYLGFTGISYPHFLQMPLAIINGIYNDHNPIVWFMFKWSRPQMDLKSLVALS